MLADGGHLAGSSMADLDPSDLGFNPSRFPAFRSQQIDALEGILSTDKKVVVVQAPTGTGKTLIAAGLARMTGEQVVYVCTTKQLQDQVIADFSTVAHHLFGVELKGRNNYPTLLYDFPDVTAESCERRRTDGHCRLCCDEQHGRGKDRTPCSAQESCPYEMAKAEAIAAPFPVLNLSMYLHISQYEEAFLHVPWLVIDEADQVEGHLIGFMELHIREAIVSNLRLRTPEDIGVSLEDWLTGHVLPAVHGRLERNQARIGSAKELEHRRLTRDISALEGLAESIERVLASMSETKWVWIPERWTLKPIGVSSFAPERLWKKADKVVFMSATISNRSQFCLDLGIPQNSVKFIDLPSSFPVENRPVYFTPAASLNRQNEDTELPKVVAELDRILDLHPDVKVLVHAVSYGRVQRIFEMSRHQSRMLVYTSATERDRTLETFKNSPKPLVLIAPSMDRGVSLDDDLCRVIVVCKLPYPSLGDPAVKARLRAKRGAVWFALETARTLVQMTGRAVRHEKDWAECYILDAQFEAHWERWPHLYPEWWSDALVWPKKKPAGIQTDKARRTSK
ncbi:MAG: ATP-dependent DNA helicase [Chloroflexi bacterium]|nr:ATP-dependent DNA helicase [Chloroflexota bacterium]